MSHQTTRPSGWSRREWMAAVAGVATIRPAMAAPEAPTAPVAIARCNTYGGELLPTMAKLFDQLGGLEGLVRNKTVAIKVNMTGDPTIRFHHRSAESTYWTHPNVTGAVVQLMVRAGARRIRILESFAQGTESLEENMIVAGWEPNDLLNIGPNVEMENIGFLGYGKKYSRMKSAGDAYIYPGFDFNHSIEECDVFVTIPKLKEHITAGVTLAMKNHFGIAPPTIYGDGAGLDEPALVPNGGRSMFHGGSRQPSRSAPGEIHPNTSSDGGFRVPRIVADLVAARPIHLSIIDGVQTIAGGEGPWTESQASGGGVRWARPGVLVAGLNPVCTDAVGTALMGFDPMAERGSEPFETCDSTLQLAEARGIGTRDLNRIEVIGPSIADLATPFRKIT